MDRRPQGDRIVMWHWNANGYRCRKAVLQQHLRSLDQKELPDVIAIQETHAEDPKITSLPGYRAYARPPSARTCGKGAAQGVCTFVRKGITSVGKDEILNYKDSAIEANVTEIIIAGKKGRGKNKASTTVYIANVYSNPQHGNQRFKTLLHKIRDAAHGSGAAAVVCGDFNAPHEELGYTRTTVKGKRLLEDAEEASFELLTDPAQPTRIGTSTARDTTPDLSFVHLPRGGTARWKNTGWNLGSDHYIVEVTIPLAHARVVDGTTKRRQLLTDWHKFREADLGEVDDVERWSASLVSAAKDATTEVEVPEEADRVDPRLAHLVEARRSLQRRWKRQRHNRTLRKRVAALGKEIERYSRQLCAQQWYAMCSEADGQLHRGGTWALLRHLMDETKSKEHQRHRMSQILHAAANQLGEAEMHKRLNDKYLPATNHVEHPEYDGAPNPLLDREIEEWEVRQATNALNCRSAAGPDKVTNKALRNISDAAVSALTKYFNACWTSGSLPKQWKTAKTILLPKPNKPPGIEGLRPISLTSCVGKVLEHVLNNRWQRYLEENGHYNDSMLGFRSRLGTQDAMLLLQREVLEPAGGVPQKDNRAILGLDLQSAFDKVEHSAILACVAKLNMGKRTYDYVRSFLTRRTARLEVGGERLEERELGSVGTPQGSVISPLLFNIVMIAVAKSLDALGPKIRYCIYADDVTIWATGGSDGDIEAGLQAAIDAVETTLRDTGLKCSPQKSQLLVLPPPGRWRKRAAEEAERNIVVRASDGTPVPHVQSLRVLGMYVDAHRTNGTAANHIVTKIGIATRLVKRVTSRSRGIREASLLRLLQAFAVSHAAYAGAFHKWTEAERKRIDAAIRKAYAGAMGLLNGTKTTALLSLGAHNTLSEIGEAQRTAQLTRLGRTAVGRRLLERVGLSSPEEQDHETSPLTESTMRRLVVYPLPKNMGPGESEGRRAARARALLLQHQNDEGAVYVDVAKVKNKDAYVAAAVAATTGKIVTSCSVRTRSASQAEEMAIALAARSPGVRTILSDSKTAIRSFSRGAVCGAAARALASDESKSRLTLKWFPAHMGRDLIPGSPNRNEEADAAARGLATCRTAAAPASEDTTATEEEGEEQLLDYGDILAWYREQRRGFPPPHRDLTRWEAVRLRQLQTETVLTPSLARHVCPELYVSEMCSVCASARATLAHILWGCDADSADGPVLPPQVEQRVGSTDPEDQRRAVRQLEVALALQRRKGDTLSNPSGDGARRP